MKITKRQLRRIIREELELSNGQIHEFFGLFGKKKKIKKKIENPVYVVRVDGFPKDWARSSYLISREEEKQNKELRKKLGKELGVEITTAINADRDMILVLEKIYDTASQAEAIARKVNDTLKKLQDKKAMAWGLSKFGPEAIAAGKGAVVTEWDPELPEPWDNWQ